MTNAEKFKEVYGYEYNGCPHGKHCSEYDDCGLDCYNCTEEWWKSEYLGEPTIPLSVIEDIKAKIEDEIDEEFDLCVRHSGRDVLRLTCLKEFRSLIDRKVNEVKHD